MEICLDEFVAGALLDFLFFVCLLNLELYCKAIIQNYSQVFIACSLDFLILFSIYVGVNLLIGTDNGLYLLDRSGNDKGENIYIILAPFKL